MIGMGAGWSIAEAIKTIVDQERVAEWKDAIEERKNLPEHSGIAILGGGDPDNPYIDRGEAFHRESLAAAEGLLAHTRRAVFDDLKELMRYAPLVAWGHKGSVTGPSVQITGSQWAALTEFNETASAVFGSDGSGFHGVTIYPILEAPGTAALIEPCSLASALDQYVLRDPEVSMRIDGTKGGLPANLRDVVGSLGDGRCLIHLTDDAAAIKTDLTSMQEPSGGWQWHHNRAVRVDTLASRLAALGGLLICGELCAIGIEDGNEEESFVDISREDLLKPGTRLCLATGDIWKANEEPRRLFHSVRIEHAATDKRAPEANSPVTVRRGRTPTYRWSEVIPAAIAEAMAGKYGRIECHMDLYRIIRQEFAKRNFSAPPDDPEKEAVTKKHMETNYRWLLDAINDANCPPGKPR